MIDAYMPTVQLEDGTLIPIRREVTLSSAALPMPTQEEMAARAQQAQRARRMQSDSGWCCTRPPGQEHNHCVCAADCECVCYGCPDCEFRDVVFG